MHMGYRQVRRSIIELRKKRHAALGNVYEAPPPPSVTDGGRRSFGSTNGRDFNSRDRSSYYQDFDRSRDRGGRGHRSSGNGSDYGNNRYGGGRRY